MKRMDYPTFSNGTEGMWWLGQNCDTCIKAEHPVVEHKILKGYANRGRCKVNKELLDSMVTGGVSLRVHRIIKDLEPCPFIKTEWNKRKKRDNEPQLFEV